MTQLRKAVRRNAILSLGLTILTAACVAAPTGFQPATQQDGDGYTVTQLEANRYQIGFTGNFATTHQAVDDDLLYLAARVTLRNGADWFDISRASSDKDTIYPTFFEYPGYFPSGGPIGSIDAVSTDYNNPQDSWNELATILLYRGAKPNGDPSAYDARDITAHLAPYITHGAHPGPY